MSERSQAPARIEEFALQHPVRVRWAETDRQGIVFNAHYLMYFDLAQTEHFRALDWRGANGFRRFGLDIFVVNANLDYRASAAFDEMITLCARVEHLGRTSLRYRMAVFRDEVLLVEGTITYVVATREGRVPTPIPQEFVDRVMALERVPPARKAG
ncbi:MAG TPA: thioesterase family protein [Acetobacteraceae bacterium]|nr:thioesterase family protein [Acetobacteraceae bacterium]